MEKIFKYHGLGNDFVVLDRRGSGQDIGPGASRRLCDRRHGVGADGVLVLLPSTTGVARMVVHNSDGSVAEMCGNGLRCAVKYLVEQGSDRPERVQVETGAGVLESTVLYDQGSAREVQVHMGKAVLISPQLPSGRTGRPFVAEEVPGHRGLRGTAVSMGNPHLVLFGADLGLADQLGPRLEHHPDFPQRTNVEFAQLREGEVELVVWERGAGLTQACGTGACATVVAGVLEKRLAADAWTRVRLPGGVLSVQVSADLSHVHLRGPAEFVFEGEVATGLLRE